MNLNKIEKIINKVEGAGTFALDTPLAFYRITELVNSFDWSSSYVGYNQQRVIFKASGIYKLVPVMEIKEAPTTGTVGVDYDYVNGRYWLYMKPKGVLTYDTLAVSGIGAVKLRQKVTGGVM